MHRGNIEAYAEKLLAVAQLFETKDLGKAKMG
jgi:hypothetical protein